MVLTSNLTGGGSYLEDIVAEIICTVSDCYPVPQITLQLDEEPLEDFTKQGMEVHFAVVLEKCYNQLPLTCCAGGAQWDDACSENSFTSNILCMHKFCSYRIVYLTFCFALKLKLRLHCRLVFNQIYTVPY